MEGDHQRARTIALFPAEVAPGTAVLDVPVRAPMLIQLGERITARRHRRMARLGRQLRQALGQPK